MKKTFGKVIALLAATTALVACGGDGEPTNNIKDPVNVTFNYNYSGVNNTVVTVEKGTPVARPTDPTRTGFSFDGWYLEKEAITSYDFTTNVTADFSLFASWLDASKTYKTVTLDLNYTNAPEAHTLKVEQGGYAILPSANPTREGYEFSDWFTDAACTNKFKVITQINENTTLYAGWTKQHVFEAEYISTIEDMAGAGYSGTATGLEMIKGDKGQAKASNNHWVTYLYANGIKLEYVINSDVAVDNVKMVLSLSAEVMDITFTCEEFKITVNDETIPYSTISITDVPKQGSGVNKEFKDFTISKTVSLKAGQNKITLLTNNTRAMFGTMSATAPMVDCMKLTTDANLTWEPATGNIQ